MKRRSSVINKISDQEFGKIVLESKNYSDICRKLDLRTQGSNFNTIKKRIIKQNLSIEHFVRGTPTQWLKNEIEFDKIFVENSNYHDGKGLKKKLLKNNIIKYECEKCHNPGQWNDEILALQLDHVNGNRKDNRIENLRLLCPNCHSQTLTFGGKRFKKEKEKETFLCPKCNSKFSGHGSQCPKCWAFSNRKVKHRPKVHQLLVMVKEMGFSATGRKYGVTDNTIRNWIKRNI